MTIAERLALGTAALGVLHHIDHVLRYDHSGWPFRQDVGPFTFSLLVYPLIAAVLLLRRWPRTRVSLAFILFLFPTLAHILLETPSDQYHTWAHRPDVNLLAVGSPMIGWLAVVVTIALSAAALVTLTSFWREARSPQATTPQDNLIRH